MLHSLIWCIRWWAAYAYCKIPYSVSTPRYFWLLYYVSGSLLCKSIIIDVVDFFLGACFMKSCPIVLSVDKKMSQDRQGGLLDSLPIDSHSYTPLSHRIISGNAHRKGRQAQQILCVTDHAAFTVERISCCLRLTEKLITFAFIQSPLMSCRSSILLVLPIVFIKPLELFGFYRV